MKKITLFLLVLAILCSSAFAQQAKKNLFSMSSPGSVSDANYGTITVTAGSKAMMINTVMAYGENVKGLTIQINSGFAFKLAPSQNGSILNYVGSTLGIVLQPGDKAKIEFITTPKAPSQLRHLYVAGEIAE